MFSGIFVEDFHVASNIILRQFRGIYRLVSKINKLEKLFINFVLMFISLFIGLRQGKLSILRKLTEKQ